MVSNTYHMAEFIWGLLVVTGIFGVNGCVLLVLGKSRALWKPRHLWMACLCVTDLFAGAHKSLELLNFIWPKRDLCVFHKAILGIPFAVNMLLLTLLSLDRYVAVRYPFYYSASVSNRHVFIGFILVLLIGSSLASASIMLGMRDPVCRAHKLQLVYLTVVLVLCSALTLFFNTSVLKIAKRQLNAIYAQELVASSQRISIFCDNCGYENATLVQNLVPALTSGVVVSTGISEVVEKSLLNISFSLPHGVSAPPSPKPHVSSTILSVKDLETLQQQMHNLEGSTGDETTAPEEDTIPSLPNQSVQTRPLSFCRTLSLPILSEGVTLIVPADPIVPAAAVTLNKSTIDLMESTIISEIIHPPENNSEGAYSQKINVALPRSRSFTCAKKSPPEVTVPMSRTFFRSFQTTGSQIFQMGKLFPTIRFAWTVLIMMIPMWIFILPVIIIIPLHLGCVDNGKADYDCGVVDQLWEYLVVHVRCILPLEAIVDTLLYACSSREFRHCFWKLLK